MSQILVVRGDARRSGSVTAQPGSAAFWVQALAHNLIKSLEQPCKMVITIPTP